MIKIINREISHFKQLSTQARALTLSYFFYALSYPIITTFINAYIWKNNNQLIYLVYYRMGHFALITLAFLANGLLLRKIKIKWLHFIGALALAISAIAIVFLNKISLVDYLIAGAIFGIGVGFFWSNRNYLISKSTTNQNRNYFYGFNYPLSIVLALIASFTIGWLIVFGLSYSTLMVFAFIFLSLSGYAVIKTDYISPSIKSFLVIKPSFAWQIKRITLLGIGLFEGLGYFIPSIIVLKYLGNEGVLGTLTALSSLISALLIYIFARKSNTSNKSF